MPSPLPGKDPSLIVLDREPPNAGPPADALLGSFLTPTERFFVRSHGVAPEIDPSSYRLTVEGLVERPLRLSLEDLSAGFERVERAVTLQCAGNRRDEMAAVAPIPGELLWGSGALGTARWGGYDLGAVLEAAGARAAGSEDLHVAFEGLDRTVKTGAPFGGSIPLEQALGGGVLLATTMNGAPLPADHGFPLRLVVPGTIGARSVKWLGSIRVQEGPSENFFQQKAYRLALTAPGEQPSEPGEMLNDLAVTSAIAVPREGDRLAAGPVELAGYAVTGGGRRVETLEVSTDDGASWVEVPLGTDGHGHAGDSGDGGSEEAAGSPWTWRLWRHTVELGPGTHRLAVRATDSGGRGQPARVAETWNAKGYMNNAWHRVTVRVDESR